MATKTISIDLEAYHILKDAKRENESFSQVIKRTVRKRVDIEEWLERMRKIEFSDEFVDAVEDAVENRRRGRKREY